MISFRCRKHRQPVQLLWQITSDDAGRLAARSVEGNYKDGTLVPGGWHLEPRPLSPGLYCQTCLAEGDASPLPDYDEGDLADAGLLDVPHIGTSADEFDLDSAWLGVESEFGEMIVAKRERTATPAEFDGRLRSDRRLHEALRDALFNRVLGGSDLWSHQAEAISASLSGRDVVSETATASGKSLTYWTPVLNGMLADSSATAIYLAPLNALVEDQLQAVERFSSDPPVRHAKAGSYSRYVRKIRIGTKSVTVARYDGTLNQDIRRMIRADQPQIVITNPDMLHRSMIPHHAKAWAHLFANLRYIVLDEIHYYRGMFGANLANLLRRMLRIADYYGSDPQIIACSASIGNPKELFAALTGRSEPVVIPASANGAPVHRQIRAVLDIGRADEAMSTVAKDVLVRLIGQDKARTIAFMRSIPEVDQVYRYVTGELSRMVKGIGRMTVREYKREIPPDEKARVTADLRAGATLGVISTTALQLGIDVGDLSVCVVCKYPGSRAAFFQQAGRVGRRGASLVLYLADQSPLDQHFVRRPEELLDAPAEVVYLNPDHKETVLNHLWCAIEELPFDATRDAKFFGANVRGLLKELVEEGRRDGREVLMVGKPGDRAKEVDIRSLGFDSVVRDADGNEVARPDVMRAIKRFHKYARFQIQDSAYEVTQLSINWHEKKAEALARRLDRLDYSTSSVIRTECEIQETEASMAGDGGVVLERGDVRFTVVVDGYYKIPVSKSEKPQYQPLGLAAPPRHELDTQGLWFTAPPGWLDDVAPEDRAPSVKTASESLRIAAALLCSTDPDDVGVHVEADPTGVAFRFFLADNAAGGNGLTEQVFNQAKTMIEGSLRILAECPNCKDHPESRGCPKCVTTPWGKETDVCRSGGITILRRLHKALNSAHT